MPTEREPTCVISGVPAARRRWTTRGASSTGAGWPSPTGWSTRVGTGTATAGPGDARRHRLPGHAGPRQHPPPPVPEPHPGLPADDEQAAVRLAAVAVPAVARARQPRRPTCRRGSAWPSWRCRAAPPRPITSTSIHAEPATCSPPRSRPPTTSACASIRREARCRCREKDGGLPPDDVVADDDEILAASEEAVARHHDRAHGAMVRIALAPCSPFTVTEELMVRSAELAERLDVRLHTHFAENAEDDEFSIATFGCRPTEYLERTGWCTDRAWVAHCVMPDADEVRRLGAAGVGVAHCPSSNMILSSGIAPVVDAARRRRAGRARRRRVVVGRRRRRCGWRPARRCCSPSCATARRR